MTLVFVEFESSDIRGMVREGSYKAASERTRTAGCGNSLSNVVTQNK